VLEMILMVKLGEQLQKEEEEEEEMK